MKYWWQQALSVLLITCVWILGQPALPGQSSAGSAAAKPMEAGGEPQVTYLPLQFQDFAPPSERLCRFGLGASSSIASYPVAPLRIGWYTDWTVTAMPSRPGGMGYVPVVRLEQTGPTSYASQPADATLQAAALANPGATWLIGNEPDRKGWQDDLEPQVYARAYHDLYQRIKAWDPTAQISAGGIVQPTPLRLQYLDKVLATYRSLYGAAMPVDVWNIHAYILPERSCAAHPNDCWGADIPPGIDADQGATYEVQDNDNLEIFKQFMTGFRQWMADNGYRDQPLIITEYGILMWDIYGFTTERVNNYMNATFDYLRTATDPALGYPADGNRLVQRWAWYSMVDKSFNGWLFDPETRTPSAFGQNFAAYTSRLTPAINLKPDRIWTDPESLTQGETATLTIYARVYNEGDMPTRGPIVVRFFDGAPSQGGVEIGQSRINTLDGCGSAAVAQVIWENAAPGTHALHIVIDSGQTVAESNENDNTATATVSW